LDRSQSFVYSKKVCGVQRRGQLMGTFLSFPALCLVNYLTFKWLVPRDVPVKVNGDDIVFRSTRQEAEKWMEGVGASGLVLSKGKTLVNERFFTLNSTPFRAWSTRVAAVPFVRARCLFTKPDTPSSWAGQYSSLCPGFSGPSARPWRLEFLRRHQTQVWLSQRSITRGMMVPVSESLLRQAGLLRRERFYLSFNKEEPLRALSSDCPRTVHPPGYTRVSRSEAGVSRAKWAYLRRCEKSFSLACRLFAQTTPILIRRGEWVDELQQGTHRFWDASAKIRHLFETKWRKMAAPFARVEGPGRVVEKLMLPRGQQGKRGGVGMGRCLAAVDEL
jgi:hypothetical protein